MAQDKTFDKPQFLIPRLGLHCLHCLAQILDLLVGLVKLLLERRGCGCNSVKHVDRICQSVDRLRQPGCGVLRVLDGVDERAKRGCCCNEQVRRRNRRRGHDYLVEVITLLLP